MKTYFAAASLACLPTFLPTYLSALTLESFDLRIVEVVEVARLRDAAPVPGPELSRNAWIFDMLSPTSFRITSDPSQEPQNLQFRYFNTYVFISDLRYAGIPTPADPLTLTLIDGDATDITAITADVATTGFGIPGMAFNILGEGSGFGQVDPVESWTFSFTTDVAPVPLPGSLPLLAVAVGALGARRALRA
ncbi:hypothetical protein DKT77_16230 [Meridianimarinicoccus roseus]|uniref:Uncharacterized protein n=1 Tax=Meridianimarinicoccus roseus TaxID=2072018 RepID=A0A2V2L8F6_9RHOB|nr:hypothetical protein [Meridianimarinicoccus roseus]PWR01670.1 hypothetical protein DKT77_16230 [Meridianimarinicoccus roseus]